MAKLKFPFFKPKLDSRGVQVPKEYADAIEGLFKVLQRAHSADMWRIAPQLDTVARANPDVYKKVVGVKGTERGVMAIAVLQFARARFNIRLSRPWLVGDLTQLAGRLISGRGAVAPEVFPDLVNAWIENEDQSKSFARIAGVAEDLVDNFGLTPAIEAGIRRCVDLLKDGPGKLLNADEMRQASRFRLLLNQGQVSAHEWNDPWQKQIVEKGWSRLLDHAMAASSNEMSDRWAADARIRLEEIGPEAYLEAFSTVLDSIGRMKVAVDSRHGDMLRGLIWIASLVPNREVPAMMGRVLVVCAFKISGVGARSKKGFGAAVQALEKMGTLESLAILSNARNRIKLPSLAGTISSALIRAARAQSLSVEELEELVVPDYGLEVPGVRIENLGSVEARIVITTSTDTELQWLREGKTLKSAPAEVRQEHAEILKELKASAAEISVALSAQKSRIEAMMLSGRTLPYPVWRERYAFHPLLANMTRRLVWRFASASGERLGMPLGGIPTDIEGRVILDLDEHATVRLWHPIQAGASAIEAWREFLVEREIQQPFKQAHREIYVLTDAEVRTETYSNRFAAHVLKQHQMHALALARGWRHTLMGLSFDGGANPTIDLQQWGIRAEFFVEATDAIIGPDGDNSSASGIALYVLTDQVRFSDQHGASLSLESVPPVVFSEVMRDVDLFVGVASVGNDPNWEDQGDQGAFGGYWRRSSFGDLSATADTRRAVLERLLPRLTIGKVSKIEGKFLVVTGKLRTYKIHLGSGNILMSPNDQYLCIVPGSGEASSRTTVYLPFEGDRVLAIILSKAFMLVNDDKITDRTITRQIRF